MLLRKYVEVGKRALVAILKRTLVIRSHYRLRSRIDCVTDACNLIEENYGTIGSNAFNKSIEKRLSWLDVNFSQLPAHHKVDLYTLFAGQSLQLGGYSELKRRMLKAPHDLLPCKKWLNLHAMCCFRGRYTLAQIFREKARQLAIKPIEGREFEPPISWENTIGAAIEGGECNRSEDLNQLLERAGFTVDVASKWQHYFAVLNGDASSREWLKQVDGADFLDYLADKTIAIIGPAPTDASDAEEIATHDLVVRLNHSFAGKGTDQKCKGLRTDITYFNLDNATKFMAERDGVLPSEVTWGCFKSPELVDKVKEKNKDKHARTCLTFSQCQFHGNFNLIPAVALDLSLFADHPLKIYHTDLMLTVVRQKGYYPKNFKRSNDFSSMQSGFRRDSISHDPIQQYRTLNSLWRNDKITGDERFLEVMKKGLDAYLCQLERVYASFPVDPEVTNA